MLYRDTMEMQISCFTDFNQIVRFYVEAQKNWLN